MRINQPLTVFFLIVFLGLLSASPIAEAESQDDKRDPAKRLYRYGPFIISPVMIAK